MGDYIYIYIYIRKPTVHFQFFINEIWKGDSGILYWNPNMAHCCAAKDS